MKKHLKFKNTVSTSILVCFVYWMYLLFNSQPQASCDALGYELLGRYIYNQGWAEYFKTGPNREPLYPFIIAFSMKAGEAFSVSYYKIQIFLQILMLLATQLLSLVILRKLGVSKILQIAVILYLGFSPAIVNSAFSLFSEIVVLPLVLGIILISVFLFKNIGRALYVKLIAYSGAFSALFLLATFAKGVFRYVFIIFLLFYIFEGSLYLLRKKIRAFNEILFFTAASFIFFNGFFFLYKGLNLKYNGNFEFTDRYGSLLYGNALKRSEKLNTRIFLAHLASIPGEGVASIFFEPEEVKYCGFERADYLRSQVSHLTDREIVPLAYRLFLKRPCQYILFMGIESARMFFWETTSLGFVQYPLRLQKLFDFRIFRDGIRLVMSLLTITSFFWLAVEVIKKRKILFKAELTESEPEQLLFFMLMLIASYIGMHSLFSVVTRYALPIAPLYLITSACFLNNLMQRRVVHK